MLHATTRERNSIESMMVVFMIFASTWCSTTWFLFLIMYGLSYVLFLFIAIRVENLKKGHCNYLRQFCILFYASQCCYLLLNFLTTRAEM